MARFIELLAERGMGCTGRSTWAMTAACWAVRCARSSPAVIWSSAAAASAPHLTTTRASAAAAALGRQLALHPGRELIWERVQTAGPKAGPPPDPDHPDTQRRFEMGVFPVGAGIVPNPYNRIRVSSSACALRARLPRDGPSDDGLGPGPARRTAHRPSSAASCPSSCRGAMEQASRP